MRRRGGRSWTRCALWLGLPGHDAELLLGVIEESSARKKGSVLPVHGLVGREHVIPDPCGVRSAY
jgi:hypothetical protein